MRYVFYMFRDRKPKICEELKNPIIFQNIKNSGNCPLTQSLRRSKALFGGLH